MTESFCNFYPRSYPFSSCEKVEKLQSNLGRLDNHIYPSFGATCFCGVACRMLSMEVSCHDLAVIRYHGAPDIN